MTVPKQDDSAGTPNMHSSDASGSMASADLLQLFRARDAEEVIEVAYDFAIKLFAPCDIAFLVFDEAFIGSFALPGHPAADLVVWEKTHQSGPSWESARNLAPVSVPLIEKDRRWHRWGDRAHELGLRSAAYAPLNTRPRPAGALVIASSEPEVAANLTETALHFASDVSEALTPHLKVYDLRSALKTRQSIGTATGLLMARYAISEEQAFKLIRRYSHDSRIKIRDLARHVIKHRDLPNYRTTTSPQTRRTSAKRADLNRPGMSGESV